MRSWPLTLALALGVAMAGCTGDRDSDHDGFTEEEGDCNDDVAAVNPNGSVIAESASWISAVYDCPRGASRLEEPNDTIRLRVANNSCSSVSIEDAEVQVTIVDAYGTFNYPGEAWSSQSPTWSPSTIEAGRSVDVMVDASTQCSNSSGGGAYNVYQATVTLHTSAGVVEATTSDTHMTRFVSVPGPASDSHLGIAPAGQGGGAR